MKQSVLAATVLYVATASAGLFGGDSTTNVQSGPGGKGGNSRGGNGGSSSSGAATGGNGGKTGRGGSVGGVSGVTAGAGYGATNNAPIIVGPSQSVVNGVPKVVPGSISFGNSVNLGGGYGGSNTVNNNGNKGGKSGSANGNSKNSANHPSQSSADAIKTNPETQRVDTAASPRVEKVEAAGRAGATVPRAEMASYLFHLLRSQSAEAIPPTIGDRQHT